MERFHKHLIKSSLQFQPSSKKFPANALLISVFSGTFPLAIIVTNTIPIKKDTKNNI